MSKNCIFAVNKNPDDLILACGRMFISDGSIDVLGDVQNVPAFMRVHFISPTLVFWLSLVSCVIMR